MSRFWSNFVSELEPYVPGEQPKDDASTIIKLNTNENPYPPSPSVASALRDFSVDDLRLYPDPESKQLVQAIAEYHGASSDNVFVGNGSDEVLAHAFNAFFRNSKPILFPDITYSFYPVYCNFYGIEYRTPPLADDFTIDFDDYALDSGGVIFANPNAPTGIAKTQHEIRQLLEKNQSSVVIVDEAYVDFAKEDISVALLTQEFDHLLVVQTLSKSRSLAGLRLGYAIGSKELIEGLRRVKNSFNSYPVDQLAVAAALASFSDREYFEMVRQKVIEQRAYLVASLSELGFSSLPSSANFVMVKHARLAARALMQELRKNGILVRYFDKRRIGDYLRITVGTEIENRQLVNVLDGLVKNL